jgi:hypothetical protein
MGAGGGERDLRPVNTDERADAIDFAYEAKYGDPYRRSCPRSSRRRRAATLSLVSR